MAEILHRKISEIRSQNVIGKVVMEFSLVNRHIIEEQPSQTLAKGLIILEAFTLEHPQWGVRELARHLNMSPSTVIRLISTLQNLGYLEQLEHSQRYILGPMALRLGNIYSYHNPFPSQAKKVFEQYTDRFAFNFYLGTLDRDEVLYLAVLDGRGPIKVVVAPGGATGLHSTALGKVLLAHKDKAYIERIITKERLKSHTKNTITDPQQLLKQIDEIRQKGFAVNNGEHFESVGAVGVPIRNAHYEVFAGISLAYPQILVQNQNLNVNDIIDLAFEVSDQIGTIDTSQSI